MKTTELLKKYSRGEMDLSGVNLYRAYLEGADLKGVNLRGAYLYMAYLKGVNLRGAYLRGAYLRGAYLEGANLEGANLEGADITSANLRGAHLEGADLRWADLLEADLLGANLEGAITPDGRIWEEYLEDHLAGLCNTPEVRSKAIEAWGKHTWEDCPMHAALNINSVTTKEIAFWVACYDSKLLEKPEV